MAHASRLGQKGHFFGRFSAFYGQRSVTAAWATRSPWSILYMFASQVIPIYLVWSTLVILLATPLVPPVSDHLQPGPAHHPHLLVCTPGQEPPPVEVLKRKMIILHLSVYFQLTWTTSPSQTTLLYQAHPEQVKIKQAVPAPGLNYQTLLWVWLI